MRAGFLQPGFSTERLFRGSDDWSTIEGRVNAYTAKVLAFCTAAVAILSAVAWRGISMVAM